MQPDSSKRIRITSELRQFFTNIPTLKQDDREKLEKELKAFEAHCKKFAQFIKKSTKTRNSICGLFCYVFSCAKCAYIRQCLKCTRFWERGAAGLFGRPYDNADMLFGDYDQCRFMLNKSFQGKHLRIPSLKGRVQPEIDCMFFPCTLNDEIRLFEPGSRNESLNTMDDGGIDRCKYLDKPTIIMCNPNALIYQWMISSANAYWLDFFLRRECNVLSWNNRGYGASQQSIFSPNIDMNQQRIDAERVVHFMVNTM